MVPLQTLSCEKHVIFQKYLYLLLFTGNQPYLGMKSRRLLQVGFMTVVFLTLIFMVLLPLLHSRGGREELRTKDSNHKEIKGNKIRQTRQNNGGNELYRIWTFHRLTHAGRLTDILFDILSLPQWTNADVIIIALERYIVPQILALCQELKVLDFSSSTPAVKPCTISYPPPKIYRLNNMWHVVGLLTSCFHNCYLDYSEIVHLLFHSSAWR